MEDLSLEPIDIKSLIARCLWLKDDEQIIAASLVLDKIESHPDRLVVSSQLEELSDAFGRLRVAANECQTKPAMLIHSRDSAK